MVANATQVRPAPLACAECRAKHLKCDGGTPRCRRCDADGLDCVYKPSRRGYGRRNVDGRYPGPPRSPKAPDAFDPITPITTSPTESHHARTNSGPSTASHDVSTHQSSQSGRVLPSAATIDLQTVDSALFIKSYYAHFHPAHPLLVPQSLFAQRAYPDYLKWTVCFIGRQYAGQVLGSLEIDAVIGSMLAPEKDQMTACRVQALIIYAIALHSLCRPQEALECMRRATYIADALGLSRPEFASSNAALGSVEEESIRRTWWELYIIEAYLAALHRRRSLVANGNGPYPLLPGCEASYDTAVCDLNPVSLTCFENRAFAQEHQRIKFSTYCYRIEAARIIHRILDLFTDDRSRSDGVEIVDNAIGSCKYYWPDTTDGDLEDLGETDPLLFQAQFLVHSASILLHFPRSDLPSTVPTATEIECVRSHTQRIPGSLQHSMKAIAASKRIVNLAAGLPSTRTCSPLFICALILACIVQLAASALHRATNAGACMLQHRDRIILLLGVLTEMGRIWTVARTALQPLKIVAGAIFGSLQKQDSTMSNSVVTHDAGPGANDVYAGVPWFDLFSADDLMADFMASASASTL